ncbi:MAG: NUDIX hydrolase [Candidatus Pacebacteria bacterium]|nr:NUDIX hydrolase [Candidatus Paceibacterota bacterium]MDD5357077.1 NUDIX hydrolase [Candidatus Paceibacterota bacterium]
MISQTEIKDFDKKFDVVSAFVEHKGRILLLHRQDHKPQGDTWGVPAGKVDEGENFLEALVREVQEEIGLLSKKDNYISLGSYYVRYRDYDFLYHSYRVILKDEPKLALNPKEHKDFRWVEPKDALGFNLIQDEDMCIKWAYGIK